MKSFHFVKINPAGNTTAIVLDPVPAEDRASAAFALMEKNCVCAEQVAFLSTDRPVICDGSIAMMGGEFCGNAVRSTAAWLFFDRNRWQPSGNSDPVHYEILCTGTDAPVKCEVIPETLTRMRVSCDMPLPASNGAEEINGVPFVKVDFPGITHYIHTGTVSKEERDRIIRSVLDKTETADSDATGIIFLDEDRLDPWVYVRGTDTLCHEGSCGSGTAAAAAMMALQQKENKLHRTFIQPDGVIEARASIEGGCVVHLSIGGPVEITEEGIAYTES